MPDDISNLFLAAGSATGQGTQPEKDLQKSPDARESRQEQAPSDMTPELFTRDLPYALELGIEQQWAEGVEGKVSAELGTLHFGDDIVNKLVAGDPDELFNFLKTSIQEDRASASLS